MLYIVEENCPKNSFLAPKNGLGAILGAAIRKQTGSQNQLQNSNFLTCLRELFQWASGAALSVKTADRLSKIATKQEYLLFGLDIRHPQSFFPYLEIITCDSPYIQ